MDLQNNCKEKEEIFNEDQNLGRAQVVNSLVIAQFIFRMLSLPTPRKDVCQEYKTMISKFIWGGKRARINYNKIIQKIENGGIKIADLLLKNKSIKVKNNKVNSHETKWLMYDKV